MSSFEAALKIFKEKNQIIVQKQFLIVNKKKIPFKAKEGFEWNIQEDRTISIGTASSNIYVHYDPVWVSKKYQTVLLIDYGFFRKRIFCRELKSKSRKLAPVFIACRGLSFEYNGKFYGILKERVLLPINEDEPYNLKDFRNSLKEDVKRKIFHLHICYDIETCANNDNKKHELYLAFFLVFNEAKEKINFKSIVNGEYLISITDDFDDFTLLFRRFINDVRSYLATQNIEGEQLVNFFGFNTFRFDNHFIYKFFSEERFDIQYNERFGKTTQATLKFNNFVVEMHDLIGWLPEFTLKEALEAYECVSKDELNIVSFNSMFKDNKDIRYWSACTDKEFFSCFDKINIVKKMSLSKAYKHSNGFNLWQCVVDYCKQDVYSSVELFEKLQSSFSFIYKDYQHVLSSPSIFGYISPPQISGIIMESFMSAHTKRIQFKDEQWFEFIRETYYGGRVDYGFIGEFYNKEKIMCMDVTSMYPLAMTAKYPVVNDNKDFIINPSVKHLQLLVDQDKCFDFLFIAACKLTMPYDKTKLCSFAPIPGRDDDGKLNFINRDYEFKVLNSIHVATAKLSGYSVEILPSKYNTVFLKNDKIFKDLVEEFGAKKTEAKEDNKALAKLYKLFMNSWQGKLAQKVHCKYKEYSTTKRRNIIYDEEDIGKSKVYYASFITAYANWILFSTFYAIQKPFIDLKIPIEERTGSLLYCDTDSIFFTFYKDIPCVEFNSTESLGYYNDEQKNFFVTWKRKMEKCNSMLIFGKKSYFCFCRDDNNKVISIDIKLKGIHTKEMAQFTFSTMKEILNDEMKTITFKGLTRKSTKINEEENLTFNNNNYFISKQIFEDTLKKTLKVNISPTKILMKVGDGIRYFY
jgi:hypothetical protein